VILAAALLASTRTAQEAESGDVDIETKVSSESNGGKQWVALVQAAQTGNE
jgi:hypothetical protein